MVDRTLASIAFQTTFAAGFLYLVRIGLAVPRRQLSMAAFAPIAGSHLAAPQFALFFLVCLTSALRRYRASTGLPALAYIANAALSFTAAAGCAAVLRRSLDGRSAFAAAIADASLDEGGGDEEVGRLGLRRVVKGIFGLPVLEWSQVEITRDIRYATVSGKPRRLDAIRRRGLKPGAPTLLYFHGGGWMTGDKALHSLPLLYHVALKMGWLVLSANYELSKTDMKTAAWGATFPEHLHDCFRAVAWARSSKALQYCGGGDCLVVSGESAGGHLSSLVGLTHRVRRMLPPDLDGADLRVDGVIDLYGPHDITKINEFRWLFRHVVLKRSSKGSDENMQAWRDAAPLWWARDAWRGNQDLAPPPPFMIVHGTHDALVPVEDARAFVAALREMRQKRADAPRVPDVYVEVPGALHGFNFAHSPLSFALSDAVCRFLGAVATRNASAPLVARL